MEKYDKDTKKAVGRGAFGVVYLYLRKEDRREVIIKQIAADDLTTEQRKGVINEIDVSAMFNHPNIIKYHEYFMEEKNFMIVMDYAPGGNLFDFLQQRQQQNMLLEEDEILKFFAQITRALHHIHNQNILHRDMKTHNILLDRRKKVLMICDFGIAKFLTKTNAITTVGTAHYMSPEVVEGKSYNKKSDIWSLGCILYELITLKRAFDGDSLSSIIQKIIKRGFSSMPEHYSEEIKDLVKGILQTDPVKRYDVNQILSQPVLINALLDLETDIGRIPCNYNFVSYQSKKAFNRNATSSGNTLSEKEVYRSKSFTSWGDEASRQAAEQTSVVYCWGNGLYLPTFLPSPGADQFIKEVCVGRTKKLGLTSNGRVFMWENENSDQSNDRLIPKLTSEFSGSTVAHISCGDHFIVAMTVHGMLMTWGSGAHGCLGHGTTDDLSTARVVEDLVGCTVTKVACGAAHVLALTTDNQVYVWGNGNSGNLGLNDLQERCNPTLVPLPSNFRPKSIFCGRNYSFIVSEEGSVLACGNNRYNKLGLLTEEQLETKNALTNDVLVFTKISSKPLCDHKIISIGTGNSHVAFLTENGLLFMAGSNKNFQLGVKRPEGDLRPYLVNSLQRVEHVACGDSFTVAVTKNNKVFTWGCGKHGRLGLGNLEESIEPKEVIINDTNKAKFHSLSASNNTVLLAGQSYV
ncbi:serine/threonine-protein kinase Nek8 isoform X2 [Hydra vulgaris]|uniref:non-specific serine/threonine protein kinase n=1 Tax=Hydra vulgaris TaxID=6087 RepID=A0ABM4DJE8_HYDVU